MFLIRQHPNIYTKLKGNVKEMSVFINVVFVACDDETHDSLTIFRGLSLEKQRNAIKIILVPELLSFFFHSISFPSSLQQALEQPTTTCER